MDQFGRRIKVGARGRACIMFRDEGKPHDDQPNRKEWLP